ncbi:disulfide bond formation protein B, partial [Hansschlegelia beijingensis]|uniref:disulfide bond formation protein B n=1 Tax=Hansschlegelia beijingensis TaxID=1133344 RepID=UPI00387F084B
MTRTRSAAILAFVIAAAAALTVGAALVFQHGFGYVPCMLCLWQRWPYYVGAPLALAAGLLGLAGATAAMRLLLAATALLFL